MEAFDRAVRRISAGALQIAAAACLICFALMCYSVAMRYFFGAPQSWIDYAVGWLVVAMVMFAAPSAQLAGEHVAVDTVSERVRGRPGRALAAFGLLCIVATAAIMIWEGSAMVAFSRMTGMMTEIYPIPLWWIQVLVPVGFGLMLAVALMQLLRVARGLDAGDAAAAEEAARLKAGPLE
ncbi:MAG: TRAP transporter small permease [Candidatus Odyssella sp.]|nr:TRAP transporter small permease [Candidatus Odyssella sp.]